MQNSLYDLIGIGIGPSNLSLAALSHNIPDFRSLFLDSKPHFQWHQGLSLPGARIQVSPLKDLVSLVDPTNPYSFVNYLSKQRRLYSYITANLASVSRQEFENYYQWVARALASLQFNAQVDQVDYDEAAECFHVQARGRQQSARHLVVGTGQSPRIPPCCEGNTSPRVFHASEFAYRTLDPSWRNIVLVGGGQTAAELFLHLMNESPAKQLNVSWVTRRRNLLPMDDSAFVNEYFYPQYSEYFFGLNADLKSELLDDQRLTSDGISADLLQSIYQRLYEHKAMAGDVAQPLILPSTELSGIVACTQGLTIELCHGYTNQTHVMQADAVILCTGYEYRMPRFLDSLVEQMEVQDNVPLVNRDYSVRWKDPRRAQKLYLQNAARRCRGVADPNLSLAAWRSAVILNAVLGREAFQVEDRSTMVSWRYPDQGVAASATALFAASNQPMEGFANVNVA
ncbi:SidA/IucD/PvdA family monooxygenase [Massilia antarctica]|uniref:SidA/IucD/PvdA family monooxygenase n=1 Tax=Massilia antarctica TaxID=2765360 RepID=A0AA49A7A5_9BURK|nr:SidA/IucD/PvdA family monooxygenase [Massilia antarctica]QPI48587.1 SidA/IucD/PvdA family monooxygenase [Massilia antarctica]